MRYGLSLCIGQPVTVDMGTLPTPPSVLPPTPSIAIVGTYSDGQSIDDVVVSVFRETSGVPPLQSGMVRILVDSDERLAGYVLSAGESLVAEFSWVHVSGVGRVLSTAVGVGATTPSQFAPADWSIATTAGGGAGVVILSLPDNGGSEILQIDYRLNGGDPVTSVGTSGFEVAGLASGTQLIALRAVNAAGPGQWSAEKPVTISGVTPTNPILILGEQQPGSGGVPDSVPITFFYGGTDIVDLFIATGPAGFAISEAELRAQSGGEASEFAVSLGFVGGEIELSGLSDDSVDDLVVLAVERSRGGSSGLQRIALTDVDFSALAVISAETDTDDGRRIFLTMNDVVLGATDPSFWTVPGHTVNTVGIAGSTVTLTVSPAIASGEVDTVIYTPGNLTDERGNPLAEFSGQSVANNLAPAGGSWTFLSGYDQTTNISSAGIPTETTASVFPSAGTYVVGIATNAGTIGVDVAGVVTAATPLAVEGSGRVGLHLVTTSGAGGITIRALGTTESTSRRIVVGRATNLTAAGAIPVTASGGQANMQTATLMAVPERRVVIAMIAYVNPSVGSANAILWGGGFASSDEADDARIAAHNFGAASKVAPSTGNFVTSCTIAGADASWNWRLAAVALAVA